MICTTISFLTLGYFVGGKLSVKESKLSILKNCFALAAFFIIIMPIWSEFLFLKYNEASLSSGAMMTSIFLIGPSVFLLGISSPIIIQMISEQTLEVGKVSGKVYAISTVAGIISTLILGYFLLPNFGFKLPLLLAAFILIGISMYIKMNFLNLIVVIIVLFIGIKGLIVKKEDVKHFETLYETEGLMGQLKVMNQTYKGNGVFYRVLFINGVAQTIMFNHNKKGISFWEYVHRISAAATLKKGKNALLIGMGGSSLANELQKQKFKLDIVDIDKRMLPISKKYFHFSQKPSTTFTVDDARHYIKTTKKKYDLIVIDICSGEVQPSNVFTVEGLAEMKKIIKNDGIVLIQYQESFNSKEISGSQSIAKTFMKNKFKVYQNVENQEIASVVLACSPQEIDFKRLKKENLTENVLTQRWLDEFLKNPFTQIKTPSKNSVLLLDDKPILEKINANTIELWRKSTMKYYGLVFLGE